MIVARGEEGEGYKGIVVSSYRLTVNPEVLSAPMFVLGMYSMRPQHIETVQC